MVSYGDSVYIHDLGIEKELIDIDGVDKPDEKKLCKIFLVEETDGSINWFINPNCRDDVILATRFIKLTDEEKKEFDIGDG